MKRLLIFFIVCLVLCIATIRDDSYPISTVNELISLFDQKEYQWTHTNIKLENDIDFSSQQSIKPLGTREDNNECVAFSGIFNGNG